jgi:hypothetical protein
LPSIFSKCSRTNNFRLDLHLYSQAKLLRIQTSAQPCTPPRSKV